MLHDSDTVLNSRLVAALGAHDDLTFRTAFEEGIRLLRESAYEDLGTDPDFQVDEIFHNKDIGKLVRLTEYIKHRKFVTRESLDDIQSLEFYLLGWLLSLPDRNYSLLSDEGVFLMVLFLYTIPRTGHFDITVFDNNSGFEDIADHFDYFNEWMLIICTKSHFFTVSDIFSDHINARMENELVGNANSTLLDTLAHNPDALDLEYLVEVCKYDNQIYSVPYPSLESVYESYEHMFNQCITISSRLISDLRNRIDISLPDLLKIGVDQNSVFLVLAIVADNPRLVDEVILNRTSRGHGLIAHRISLMSNQQWMIARELPIYAAEVEIGKGGGYLRTGANCVTRYQLPSWDNARWTPFALSNHYCTPMDDYYAPKCPLEIIEKLSKKDLLGKAMCIGKMRIAAVDTGDRVEVVALKIDSRDRSMFPGKTRTRVNQTVIQMDVVFDQGEIKSAPKRLKEVQKPLRRKQTIITAYDKNVEGVVDTFKMSDWKTGGESLVNCYWAAVHWMACRDKGGRDNRVVDMLFEKNNIELLAE